MRRFFCRLSPCTVLLLTFINLLASTSAQTANVDDILTAEQWQRVDSSVDRGLRWLAIQQQPDGSFPTRIQAQPAVTSLCVLAFMANGHSVHEGPYSDTLKKAIDYIIAQQQSNGLISLIAVPGGKQVSRRIDHSIGRSVVYNHAISSLVLSEAYGQHNADDVEAMHDAVEKSLVATLQMQRWQKERPEDQGGWRYLDKFEPADSDLSLTGWQLMFLRSAKNAGYDVPQQPIDEAVKYVRGCFNKKRDSFTYLANNSKHVTRAMAGAGILALAHAGFHNSPEAQQAGDWILEHSFEDYGKMIYGIASKGHHDRYHYGLLLCSQGMYQLGGRHWKEFFSKVAPAVIRGQLPPGNWPANRRDPDQQYGKCYVTSLCVLALSAPNQLLPIFQR